MRRAGFEQITPADTIPSGYTAIYSADDLNNIRNNLSGKYILMNDIDLSGFADWEPIGKRYNEFTGIFDGNGHVIKNLNINRPDQEDTGLFGAAKNAELRNVELQNADVKGQARVGSLLGFNFTSVIENVKVSGSVTGTSGVGGIAGYSRNDAVISNCFSDSDVTGDDAVGGICGTNTLSSVVKDCYSTGNVNGNTQIGGITGWIAYSDIINCGAEGEIRGNTRVGGVIGYLQDSTLISSFSSGNVFGTNYTGGVSGMAAGSEISNAYSSGNISGHTATGGISGRFSGTRVTNTYANGSITGVSQTGGLSGYNYMSSVKNSFWDTETTGQAHGLGAIADTNPSDIKIKGLTTAEMSNPQEYINAGWSSFVWNLDSAPPKLIWQTQPKPPPSPDPSVKTGMRLQVGANADADANAIYVDTSLELASLYISFRNENSCAYALNSIDKIIDKIASKNAEFGAVLNRLDSVMQSQTTQIENFTSGKSTIMDADIARESAEYVKNQILQRTSSSLIIQSQNSGRTIILSLIN